MSELTDKSHDSYWVNDGCSANSTKKVLSKIAQLSVKPLSAFTSTTNRATISNSLEQQDCLSSLCFDAQQLVEKLGRSMRSTCVVFYDCYVVSKSSELTVCRNFYTSLPFKNIRESIFKFINDLSGKLVYNNFCLFALNKNHKFEYTTVNLIADHVIPFDHNNNLSVLKLRIILYNTSASCCFQIPSKLNDGEASNRSLSFGSCNNSTSSFSEFDIPSNLYQETNSCPVSPVKQSCFDSSVFSLMSSSDDTKLSNQQTAEFFELDSLAYNDWMLLGHDLQKLLKNIYKVNQCFPKFMDSDFVTVVGIKRCYKKIILLLHPDKIARQHGLSDRLITQYSSMFNRLKEAYDRSILAKKY